MPPNSFSSLLLTLLLGLLLPPRLWAQQKGIGPRDLWCVAKNNAADAALQSAIDWACSAGGANCAPIQQGGPCYDAGDIQRTASWAFNDYYLKNGMTDDACDFTNTAAVTSLNPSEDSCSPPFLENGSASSTATAVGTGPADSADMSSCNRIAATAAAGSTWFWGLLAGCLIVLLFR
ncbi:unnamed protein product [Linum tenue]|uniref:X8 domain-containing protein n=1 Tax=Linum tenue TaxID=586396 RepID=A0AAV0MQH9_9ROSI|nr:unnamed protein product [Linum tenue]